MADGEVDQLRPPRTRPAWRFAIIASTLLWIVATLGYLSYLMIGHALGDTACEYPASSSNYGDASWQWWPPGTRCSYGDANLGEYRIVHAHTDNPSPWSAVTFIALLAAAALLLRAHFSRRR